MDIATFLGMTAGFGLMVWAMALGGDVTIFWDVPSVLITVGGMFGAVFINYSISQVLGVFVIVKNAFLEKKDEKYPEEIIVKMIQLAEISRKQGILSLEKELDKIHDPFLKKGMQLAIDGTKAEEIRSILETELSYIQDRHKSNQSVLIAMAQYAPAFGMIGTMIGLVQMLRTMSDPSTIGPAMAVALITTFYGCIIANLICVPLSGKLKNKSSDEGFFKQIVIEGILNIQAGDNPRIIEEKMKVCLSPKTQEKLIAMRKSLTQT